MSQGTEFFRDFLVEQISDEPAQAKALGRLTVLGPLFRLLNGESALGGVAATDADRVAAAIAGMMGMSGGLRAQLVSMGQHQAIPSTPEEYAYTAFVLAKREIARTIMETGGEANEAITKGSETIRPVVAGFIGAQAAAARVTGISAKVLAEALVPYGILPSCFLAHVIADNEVGIRRLAPYLRTMAQVIIVGAPKTSAAQWFALCA